MFQKITLSFFMSFFTTLFCFGQQQQDQQGEKYHDVLSLPDIIMKVISSTRDHFDSFFKKEDAKALNRKLGYFRNDLIDYLQVRQNLVSYVEKKNFVVPGKKKYKNTVEKLKRDLVKLGERLNDLRPYVGEEVSRSAEKTIQAINQHTQDQSSLVLSPLGNFIEGQPFDKNTFRNDANKLYNELQSAVDSISSLQTTLRSKFNL